MVFCFFLDPTKKVLKEGSVPCLNLPAKSFQNPKKPPRKTTSIQKRNIASACLHISSDDIVPTLIDGFDHFKRELVKTTITPWISIISDKSVVLNLFQTPYIVPKFQLIIDSEMKVCIYIYNLKIIFGEKYVALKPSILDY